MPTLEIKIDDNAAKKRLKVLIEALSGKRRLMAGIAHELLSHTERNFRREGQTSGAKWPALAPSARNFIIEFSEQFAAIKNPTHYAAIHQFGGHAGRGLKVAIPARPFLPVKADKKTLTPEMQQSLNKLLKAYLKKAASA